MYELQQYVPSGGAFPNQLVPQQLVPQSLFGGLLGRRFGTTYGCGPSGSLGGPRPLMPFEVDPVALAYMQQAQLAQIQQQQQFAPQSVGAASPYDQQLSPYDIHPLAAALAYQQAQALRTML